ncbi:hypothetical protein EDB89DRAFT_2076039 [Lactarius sanguifluus]|nr:hypothetical protein EDB89DRAFT_2076039 [Lactarius sanguifluus]
MLIESRTLSTAQGLSSTVRILSDGTPPKPPPPIDDSTSALDYKTSHKSRSAEEAIYNMPPPNLQPYKKTSPVLSRVSGILAGRGFNIDSLVLEDLVRFLPPLPSSLPHPAQVPVWAVLDYTETRTISRELLLFEVSILGHECLEYQLEGGPSHEPRAPHRSPRRAHAEQTKLEREMALARHFEESTRPQPPSPTAAASEGEEGGAVSASAHCTYSRISLTLG